MSRVKDNLSTQTSSCEYVFNVFVDINFIHDICQLMKKAGLAAVLFFTPLQADFDLVVRCVRCFVYVECGYAWRSLIGG